MQQKKYFILLPPFVIFGLILLFALPKQHLTYVFVAPIIFWIVYYSWIVVEKKRTYKK